MDEVNRFLLPPCIFSQEAHRYLLCLSSVCLNSLSLSHLACPISSFLSLFVPASLTLSLLQDSAVLYHNRISHLFHPFHLISFFFFLYYSSLNLIHLWIIIQGLLTLFYFFLSFLSRTLMANYSIARRWKTTRIVPKGLVKDWRSMGREKEVCMSKRVWTWCECIRAQSVQVVTIGRKWRGTSLVHFYSVILLCELHN